MTPTIKSVIHGFCYCGCGQRTRLHRANHAPLGWVKGEPRKYVWGHQNRIRFEAESGPTFKLEDVYCRLIPLTRGLYAIVDAADYEWLMQWKWTAQWNKTSNVYYAIRSNGRENGKTRPPIWMHRQIMGLDSEDEKTVDHRDPLRTTDNRRKNIRYGDESEQHANQRRRKDNQSGFKGVSYHKGTGKWVAQIAWRGKRYYLGLFLTKEEAYAAYCKAALELHGEFARVA